MDIDITTLVNKIDAMDYSASVIELGDNAAKITWDAALRDGTHMLRGSNFDRESYHAFFSSFGAWNDDELTEMSNKEFRALMLQFISSEMRESDFTQFADIKDAPEQFTSEWWNMYERMAMEGKIASNFFKDASGRVYYNISQ